MEYSMEFSQGIPIIETPVLSNAILIHYENLKYVIALKSSHFLVTWGGPTSWKKCPQSFISGGFALVLPYIILTVHLLNGRDIYMKSTVTGRN